MKAYIAFTKKELREYSRTYKFFILIIVFLLFGIMSPVIAKVMPDIIESFMPEGMTIQITTPTALDSWVQFFKNVNGMGIFIVVIVFSGIMANEFMRGTFINVLTKGLPRPTVILSKFTATALIWTISYFLCFCVTYFYTAYFWSMDNVNNLFLSILGPWLFCMLLITFIIFGGILFKNIYGSLLFTGAAAVVMLILNIIPNINKFNPATLTSANMALLTNKLNISDFIPAIFSCIALIIVFTVLSIVLFNKKQI